MFGTFLLFVIYVIAILGLIVGFGLTVFFLLKASQELTQPRDIIEIIKDPSMFLSAHGFSDAGNQYRLRFLQLLGISSGLIVLILLLKLILA